MSRLLNHNFWVRSLSGLVLLLVVVGALLASPYTMCGLLAVLAYGSMREFFTLAKQHGAKSQTVYPICVGVALVVATFLVAIGRIAPVWLVLLLPLLSVLFIVELYRKNETPFQQLGWSLLGIFYLAIPFALLTYLPVVALPDGFILYKPLLLLSIIFMVWANDVGAYLCGVTLGRHPLFPRISPKKSWEGFIGGVLCCIGVGVLIAWLQDASLLFWGGLGLLIALTSVWGDLVESMLKRSLGVKDSGSIIPGHGGFLDRFDALIFTAPFVFAYFVLFNYTSL